MTCDREACTSNQVADNGEHGRGKSIDNMKDREWVEDNDEDQGRYLSFASPLGVEPAFANPTSAPPPRGGPIQAPAGHTSPSYLEVTPVLEAALKGGHAWLFGEAFRLIITRLDLEHVRGRALASSRQLSAFLSVLAESIAALLSWRS